jgi:hypothetical protein
MTRTRSDEKSSRRVTKKVDPHEQDERTVQVWFSFES